MRLKLSVKVPTPSKAAITAKVTRAFGRAMAVARSRIIPLVVDRASTAVDKGVPEMADRYKAALRDARAVKVTDKAVELEVTDPVVVAVERGSKAFDMKPKLLAHAKRTSKKGVAYIDIAFQHKAASVPRRIKAVAAKASKLSGGATVKVLANTPGKSFTRLLQRGRIGQALNLKAKRQSVQHKRGVHDDMIRSSVKTGKRSSVSYTTIRRISANSSSTSWWHPGFKAKRVLDNVLPSLRREVSSVIRDAFSTVRSGG